MSVVYAYHFRLLHQLRHLSNQEPHKNLSIPYFLLQSLKEMSLKVKKGKQEFLAHHGLIKLIVSYSLRSLKHKILWEDFINMDLQAFEEAHAAMSEEDKKKGEEPKRITRPKYQNNKRRRKRRKVDEKDKEVVDALTALGTPSVSPLKITSAEWVQPRRRRSNRIKRSQKKKIPTLVTPLTITTQVEEVKYSPSPKGSKESKGKEPQEETNSKRIKTTSH
jgi:hypothetical protein